MGANYCKEVGIKPGKVISTKDLEVVWEKYEKKKSVTSNGTLSIKGTLSKTNIVSSS